MFARSAVAVSTTALALAVLTGCGSESAPAPVAAPTQDDVTQPAWRIERIKADCMKQKGFTYVPFVAPPQKQSELERKAVEGDYKAMKEFRTKYGFQIFAAHVYPDDPASGALVPEAFATNPNDRILGSLNKTQFTAYQDAENSCFDKGTQEVLHKKASSRYDLATQLSEMTDQLTSREIAGDPKLVELAAPFGDCLKAKGYPVPFLTPTALVIRGQEAFRAEEHKFGRGENGSRPDLTPDQARPYLAREIKAALDDLECGKDFYAAYTPKKRELDLQVRREFGGVF
ncbi:hypothetical protein [Streptosporangium lutulentum]|uniref:Uncharacterized protein n=1 Tax=Streptosporangium lutulentum TaxID=1461250 RepID=A0ABT9QR76_9ACTN|nr:hypothetical protein [Streptosporangium lutulentum]MDP9848409.1 hypothetical protein [Streptosporangium lutulentum]